MATASFIKKSRKPIYENGKRVEYVSKKGKREGETLSKIDRTIPRDEEDKIFIPVGGSYYTWSFQYGGTYYSKEKPRQSQLTQSNFLSQYYALQESIEDFSPSEPDEIESFIEDMKSNIESLQDECQTALDNMPEQLQSAPTGELLQERIDSLDSLSSELDDIDTDYEEPEDDDEDLLTEIAEEEGIEMGEDNWKEQITEDMITDMKNAKSDEWIQERLEEIGGISFDL